MSTAIEIRERPILFSGPMVRAILDGRKSVTRRVVKPVVTYCGEDCIPMGRDRAPLALTQTYAAARCPYGQPGDRLWVKETFYAFGRWETRFNAKKDRDEWHFVDLTIESGHEHRFETPQGYERRQRGGVTPSWWKRPAIFMPRTASRITLEIADVRVERVREISEADAKAEGATPGETTDGDECYALGFSDLWDSINGPRGFGWEANSWVWVVSFRRVEP